MAYTVVHVCKIHSCMLFKKQSFVIYLRVIGFFYVFVKKVKLYCLVRFWLYYCRVARYFCIKPFCCCVVFIFVLLSLIFFIAKKIQLHVDCRTPFWHFTLSCLFFFPHCVIMEMYVNLIQVRYLASYNTRFYSTIFYIRKFLHSIRNMTVVHSFGMA